MTTLRRRKKTPVTPVTYVAVLFNKRGRQYTFKTILELKENATVLVRTVQGLTFATVFKTNVKPFDNSIKYNWVIAEIDMEQLVKEHKTNLKFYGIKE